MMKNIRISILVCLLVGVSGYAQAQSEQARWEQIVTSGGKHKVLFKQEGATSKQVLSNPSVSVKRDISTSVPAINGKGTASDLVSNRAVSGDANQKTVPPITPPKISDQGQEPQKK